MLTAHGTWKKTRFGINLFNVFCPGCRVLVPVLFNRPRTFGEWLWGGATCRNCACPMTKWGDPVRVRAPRYIDND